MQSTAIVAENAAEGGAAVLPETRIVGRFVRAGALQACGIMESKQLAGHLNSQ